MSGKSGKIKRKTNRGAAKRFRTSSSGKIKHKSAQTSHNFTGKTTKRKRQFRTPSSFVSPQDKKSVTRLLAKR